MLKILFSLSLVSLMVACSSNKESKDLITESDRETYNASPVTDAEISNALLTANSEEMNLSKIGREKASNDQVKAFAEKMYQEHAMSNDKVHGQMKKMPEETISSMKFKFASAEKVEELKKMDQGEGFDKNFMQVQVETHQKVLEKIEQSLLPNVQRPELKAMLESTRNKVRGHLNEAKAISESL